MKNKDTDESQEPQAFDAPQTGPMPKDQDTGAAEETPREAFDSRDPATVPEVSAHQVPNLPPSDEQEAPRDEVMEGVDRADSDQRRAARIPANQTPPSERE